MKIIYLLLGYLANYLNSQCDELIIQPTQPFVTCYPYSQRCSFLEGDEENYQEVQHINTQIIRKSFKIPFQEDPILIRMINSLNSNKIQEKLMCLLFLNLEYYITCINFDLILYKEQYNYRELIRIDTKILANELCDELYINNDESLSLFCLGQFTLKQYSLYLQKNLTLSMEYDFSEQIQDGCKKKQMKWKGNLYFIVFYQCSKYKILLIKNDQVNTIFDAQLKYQDIQLQNLTFIDDVSFCEPNELSSVLYLIENDFYLQIYLNQFENRAVTYLLLQHSNQIQKIVFQLKCKTIFIVNQLENNNSSITNSQKILEVIVNQKYSSNNIHFHSNILFLQNQFELNVLINAHINQTYQIYNTQLHFLDFSKLFCQFDQTKKVLQFYQYYPLSAIIKPKLKYLYLIQRNELFKRNFIIKCFRIIYENNTQKEIPKVIEQIIFQNNCQNKSQILQKSKNSNYLKNGIFNLSSSEGSIRISIKKYQDFQDNCLSRLYKFQTQGKFELIDIIYDYICFQNESFFYIYDCKQNTLQISINKDQYNVLQFKVGYYFVNKNNNNVLRGIQFTQQSLLQFNLKLDEIIISVKQVSQNIFLYTNNSYLPLIIIMNSQQNLWKNYLSITLYQPEPILFYSEFGNSKLIQYVNILAFQNQENFRCYQFSESTIISIQAQIYTKDHYYIFSIQNSTKSLILNYFHDYELHQSENYTFYNYQFYYPFKYTINTQNLAILIEQNNSLYIAIFQYDILTLQLVEIIETDDTFFKFFQNDILFSQNKVWRYQFLNQFFFQLETERPYQNSLTSNFSMNLKDESGIELRILIQNQCFNLYSLKKSNQIEIQKNKNIKLNISEFLYGPISNLTLINNSNIILKGPFQFKKELQLCNDNITTFCIEQYHFKTQLNQLIFQVIVLENQIVEVIQTIQDNHLIYVTWIKQQYYLCVSYFKDNLNIELIQCSYEENCLLISNLNDNFNISQINILDIMRTGNLIKLKSDIIYHAFIFIEDINFNLYMLPVIIIDILFIEQSNNQYLILQKNMIDSIDLELTIYSINLNEKTLIYSQTITKELQIELTKNQINYNQTCTIKLISCQYSGDVINIKLFIMNQQFGQFLLLNLNQYKNQIQFELQKQIRNLIPIKFSQMENLIIEYIDDNILVLKQTSNSLSQFYDLKEDRKFYDYFHQSIFSMKINRLNTTHFIFFNNSLIYFGLIGYELELQNWDEIDQNLELLVQNELSNEKISLQIKIKPNQQFKKNILFIQISCFIFILIYIKKMKYRNQQKNNPVSQAKKSNQFQRLSIN